ncbi:carbohydrate binding domain-containing protein [Paenibacillus sp. FSL W8-0439]|uniref:carbohydrate binding domain-containing protein n=1 Tax=Paenibacillus sp. FSL W8-0439 TaxID=2921716 RepID=UPI0030F7198E
MKPKKTGKSTATVRRGMNRSPIQSQPHALKKKRILPTQAVVRNGGFEDQDLTPWIANVSNVTGQIFITRTNPHSGNQAVRISANPGHSVSLRQTISDLRRGRRYRVTFWVRNLISPFGGRLQISLGEQTYTIQLNSLPSSQYERVSRTFSISGNSGTVSRDLVFRVTAQDAFATILLDDVSISRLR